MEIPSISSEVWIWVVGAVLLDSAAGLVGGLLPQKWVQKHLASLLAFASGTLVGVALLDLLPESLEKAELLKLHLITDSATRDVLIAVLFGFIAFYVIESFLGSHASGQSGHKHDTVGPLILVGDAVHNAADGVAIAASFMVDIRLGIGTAVAVIVHELPQEVSDYAILISHGYSRMRALVSLTVVQLFALFGAVIALLAWNLASFLAVYLIALSAGGFLYIAAADLLPELHRRKAGAPFSKLLSFGLGIGVILGLQKLVG